LSNPNVTAAEAFFKGVAAQVKTIVTTTKTAALVIFLCGAVVGCIVH
jgi:hypothetical protein